MGCCSSTFCPDVLAPDEIQNLEKLINVNAIMADTKCKCIDISDVP